MVRSKPLSVSCRTSVHTLLVTTWGAAQLCSDVIAGRPRKPANDALKGSCRGPSGQQPMGFPYSKSRARPADACLHRGHFAGDTQA